MRFSLIAVIAILGLSLRATAQTALPAATPAPPAPASSPAGADQSAPVATTPASTQAQPAATPSAPAARDQTAPAAAAAPAASPAKPPVTHPDMGFLTFGWESWNVTGNRQKFQQNAAPPSGFYLEKLLYTPYSTPGNLGEISLQDPEQPTYRDHAQVALDGGDTQIKATLTGNRFYNAGTQSVDPSSRSVEDLYIRQQVANGLSLSTRDSLIQQEDSYPSPDPDAYLNHRTEYNDLALAGLAGGGVINLVYSDLHFFDRTRYADNTQTQRYEAAYEHPLGAQSLSAHYDYLAVSEAGAPSGHVQISSLADHVRLSNSTSAAAEVRMDTLNLPIVQNSYVRQQQSATANLAHTWTNWNLALAFQTRSAQVINSSSTAVDTPKWQTVEARVRGDLSRGWSVLANAWTQNLWNARLLSSTDPYSLLWSNHQYAQVRLDAVSDTIQGYLDWSYDRETNIASSTVVRDDVYDIGGDWQAAAGVDLFLDYSDDVWSANNDLDAVPTTIGQFAPNGTVITLGANWIATDTTYWSANYSGFRTTNSNPLNLPNASTSGRFLTLQFQHKLAHGRQYGITVAPWVYRDQDYDSLNYDASVVKVTFSSPF